MEHAGTIVFFAQRISNIMKLVPGKPKQHNQLEGPNITHLARSTNWKIPNKIGPIIYIYIYTHIHIYIYIYIYTHIFTHIHMYTNTHHFWSAMMLSLPSERGVHQALAPDAAKASEVLAELLGELGETCFPVSFP